MSYIAPNSTVRILRNIRLDKSYKNTIYFSNTTAQASYFASKAKYTFSSCTYLRTQNAIQVNVNSDNLYDCNYIMFQNTNFGNKWFYAFITDIEYVSNNNTLITYEIDSFQTWFLNCDLGMCFVEREHSVTDIPGDNIQPEPIEPGEYVVEGDPVLFDAGSTVYAIFFTGSHDLTGHAIYNNIDGVYSGLRCVYVSDIKSVQAIVDLFGVDAFSDIHGILAIPSKYIKPALSSVPVPYYLQINRPKSIRGYIPKNKKIFTSPYCLVRVYTGTGATATYAFENFTDKSIANFVINTYANIPPKAMISPANGYKGAVFRETTIGQRNGMPEEGLTVDPAISMSWSESPIANIISNFSSNVTSMATNAVSSVARGDLLSGAIDLGTGVFRSITNPPQVQSQNGNNSANLKWGYNTFILRTLTPKLDQVKIIDDYFNLYGYATNKLKVPNISARPNWNYIKTRNVNLYGNAPSDDIITMKNAFNSGITFWKNGDNIGNYSLDNSL